MKTWEYPPEAWAEVMRVNLDSQFYCCRAVVPLMIAQNYGRIVNVASIAGKEGNPNAPAYSASKAGVIALTKSLGKELASYDIAVNCVTPAAAKTAIFDQMTQAHIDFMLSKIPRGRFVDGGRDCGAGCLLRIRRLLVHDRRRIRHFRRTGDVLTDAQRQRHNRLIGIALMCGAVACFTCLDTTAKFLSLYMTTLQVVWARYTGAFLFAFAVSNPLTHPGVMSTRRPVLQIARSTLLLGSTWFNFLALRYLQLDEVMAIAFSTPFYRRGAVRADAGRMGRLAALDRDRRRFRRRAGGDTPGVRRHPSGRLVRGRRGASVTHSTPSPRASWRAPTATRPRCSIPTWSARWRWRRSCGSSGSRRAIR